MSHALLSQGATASAIAQLVVRHFASTGTCIVDLPAAAGPVLDMCGSIEIRVQQQDWKDFVRSEHREDPEAICITPTKPDPADLPMKEEGLRLKSPLPIKVVPRPHGDDVVVDHPKTKEGSSDILPWLTNHWPTGPDGHIHRHPPRPHLRPPSLPLPVKVVTSSAAAVDGGDDHVKTTTITSTITTFILPSQPPLTRPALHPSPEPDLPDPGGYKVTGDPPPLPSPPPSPSRLPIRPISAPPPFVPTRPAAASLSKFRIDMSSSSSPSLSLSPSPSLLQSNSRSSSFMIKVSSSSSRPSSTPTPTLQPSSPPPGYPYQPIPTHLSVSASSMITVVERPSQISVPVPVPVPSASASASESASTKILIPPEPEPEPTKIPSPSVCEKTYTSIDVSEIRGVSREAWDAYYRSLVTPVDNGDDHLNVVKFGGDLAVQGGHNHGHVNNDEKGEDIETKTERERIVHHYRVRCDVALPPSPSTNSSWKSSGFGTGFREHIVTVRDGHRGCLEACERAAITSSSPSVSSAALLAAEGGGEEEGLFLEECLGMAFRAKVNGEGEGECMFWTAHRDEHLFLPVDSLPHGGSDGGGGGGHWQFVYL